MTILKLDMVTLKADVSDIKEEFRKLLDSLDKVAKQYADYLEERKPVFYFSTPVSSMT